jgi:hypothetical protein
MNEYPDARIQKRTEIGKVIPASGIKGSGDLKRNGLGGCR